MEKINGVYPMSEAPLFFVYNLDYELEAPYSLN